MTPEQTAALIPSRREGTMRDLSLMWLMSVVAVALAAGPCAAASAATREATAKPSVELNVPPAANPPMLNTQAFDEVAKDLNLAPTQKRAVEQLKQRIEARRAALVKAQYQARAGLNTMPADQAAANALVARLATAADNCRRFDPTAEFGEGLTNILDRGQLAAYTRSGAGGAPLARRVTATTYVLKDGRRITATSKMVVNDQAILRGADGQSYTVEAADIVETIKDQTAAAGADGAAGDAAAKPAYPVIVLRDGRRITAVMTMDAGDELTVKDATGAMQQIAKKDIAETIPAQK